MRLADETKPQVRLNAVQDYAERAESPQELVELFTDQIWRFVASQLPRREDAEDIVQEVFAAAISSFEKVRRAENQRLWLLGIARKKVAGALRQRYRRAEDPLSEEHVAPAEAEGLEVAQILQTLPAQHVQALTLKYVNGLSTDEVARVIRRSLPATNSLLQRARGALKAAMKGEQI